MSTEREQPRAAEPEAEKPKEDRDAPREDDGGKKRKSSRDRDRRRSRSGSRKKDKKKKHKHSSRSRSRSPKRSDSRSKRKHRSRSRSRQRSKRSRSPPKAPEPKRDEFTRLSHTVFVSQVHPKVDERDLFEFFSHVGRVEDIRLIRDQRTYKSKGLAYVEFYDKDCVNKAIALTGQNLGGYPITVQVTPEIAKQSLEPQIQTMRLYVGSLHLNVVEKDLQPVFEAFGPLESIEIHKDPTTGKSRGFGFVTYKNESDAKQALEMLNGLEIAGRKITVGVVSDLKEGGHSSRDEPLGELDEEGGGMHMNAQSRVQLMQKLQRGNEIALPSGLAGMAALQPTSMAPAPAPGPVARVQVSPCIIIKNMFDKDADAESLNDIKEDVEDQATKFGKLKHIFVDPQSQGHVYLRFTDVNGAQNCLGALHGRWFASRKITVDFVPEMTYFLRFPQAK